MITNLKLLVTSHYFDATTNKFIELVQNIQMFKNEENIRKITKSFHFETKYLKMSKPNVFFFFLI